MRAHLGLVALLAAAAAAGACGFAPKVVHLEPLPPAARAKVARPVCLRVERFVDARADRSRIGVNRNGFGMEMGEVKTYGNVPDWIGQHFADELAAAGACLAPEGELVLAGEVKGVFVDEMWNLDGRIAVRLTLSRGAEVLLAADYLGTDSRLSWAASASEFTVTLHETLRDLSARAVPEIVAAADRACAAPAAGACVTPR